MSYLVLHADRIATALADDPLVPAADVAPLRGAVALLNEVSALRAGVDRQLEAAADAARDDGYAAGLVAGRAAAADELRAELFRLALRDREAQANRRSDVARLALEVVRRIAGELGPAETVAAIAARQTAAALPDERLTVRVAPAALAATTARLGDRPNVSVQADAALGDDDCVVETALGSVRAGLSTQLAQIEQAWARDGH